MTDDGLVTQVAVLPWLPSWMVSDFDCPSHGPHHWLSSVTSRQTTYTFCQNCERVKRGTISPRLWP